MRPLNLFWSLGWKDGLWLNMLKLLGFFNCELNTDASQLCSSLWDHAFHLDARNVKVLSCWASGRGVSCSEIPDADINLFSGSSITLGQAAALFNIRKNRWVQERKGFFLLWPSLLREMDVIYSGITCSLQQRGIHWSRRRFRRRNVCVGTAEVLWTFLSLQSG